MLNRGGLAARGIGAAKSMRLALPQRNRIAYVGWVGHGNMGDEAIFDMCRRALPGHRLFEVPHGSTFARAARLSSGPIISGALLGGGTVVGRYPAYRRPFERWLAAYPGLPAFALGVGVADPDFERIDGFDVVGELAAWKEVFDRFGSVTVRGPRSEEILSDAGIPSTVVGDPGLLVASGHQEHVVRERLLGVNVGVSSRASNIDWERSLSEVAGFARIMVDRGWRIRLIPMWTGDVPHVHNLARSIGRGVEVVDGWDRLPALLKAIGECAVFVGIKLHSVVFASALGVPSLMLEYEPKCLDFQLSIGREEFSLPLRTTRVSAILDRVDALIYQHDLHSEVIGGRVERLRNDLRRTIEEIRARLP